MKTVHYISGLPRSGSTVLTSILNQNPNFYANISNPLPRFVQTIITETESAPEYSYECPEPLRIKLIHNLIQTYHSTTDRPVCFNTNRGWTSMMPLIEAVDNKSRVICCVRDINWILDSFEVLFRKNPFSLSRLYDEYERETVYTRANALMAQGHTVRFAYDCLKEAITSNQKHMLMLIEYDNLTKNPKQVMQALYNFIEQPYFEHDFENIEASYDEYDRIAGIKDLHKVRKRIEYVPRRPILPPDIWQQYSNLEVWR
jgi:sulfotransferase